MFIGDRFKSWLRTFGLWTALVLVFSTRTEVRGEPFVWISITWTESLRIAIAQWYVSGLLTIAIV